MRCHCRWSGRSSATSSSATQTCRRTTRPDLAPVQERTFTKTPWRCHVLIVLICLCHITVTISHCLKNCHYHCQRFTKTLCYCHVVIVPFFFVSRIVIVRKVDWWGFWRCKVLTYDLIGLMPYRKLISKRPRLKLRFPPKYLLCGYTRGICLNWVLTNDVFWS